MPIPINISIFDITQDSLSFLSVSCIASFAPSFHILSDSLGLAFVAKSIMSFSPMNLLNRRRSLKTYLCHFPIYVPNLAWRFAHTPVDAGALGTLLGWTLNDISNDDDDTVPEHSHDVPQHNHDIPLHFHPKDDDPNQGGGSH